MDAALASQNQQEEEENQEDELQELTGEEIERQRELALLKKLMEKYDSELTGGSSKPTPMKEKKEAEKLPVVTKETEVGITRKKYWP